MPAFNAASAAFLKRETSVQIGPARVSALALVRTPALRQFKSQTGQNNHFIITILVGLHQIEREDVAPDPEFSTQWSPRDRVNSARRSREYTLQSSLTWLVDQLNSLRAGLLATPTAFSQSERQRVQSRDTSRDKLDELRKMLSVDATSDFRLCELAITWRNRLVHSEDTDRRVSSSLKTNLLAHDSKIRARHRGLDVADCISAYNQGRAPTLKAVTSFVQAAQEFATALDQATVRRVSAEEFVEDAIRTWATESKGTHAITKTWGGTERADTQKNHATTRDRGYAGSRCKQSQIAGHHLLPGPHSPKSVRRQNSLPSNDLGLPAALAVEFGFRTCVTPSAGERTEGVTSPQVGRSTR